MFILRTYLQVVLCCLQKYIWGTTCYTWDPGIKYTYFHNTIVSKFCNLEPGHFVHEPVIVTVPLVCGLPALLYPTVNNWVFIIVNLDD